MTRFSDLLGVHVRTESGDHLGCVHDLRAELTSRSLRVTGLVVGKLGVLERLGIGAPESAARIRTRDLGGSASTSEFADAVCRELESAKGATLPLT